MIGTFFKQRPANGTTPNGHNTSALIELQQVVKSFQTAAGLFTALKGVDLQVGQGEFIAIVGKSGSGKSTLINMLTGIDRPTAGAIYIEQTPLHTLGENQMAVWRSKHVGIVFQFFQLLPTLTVIENVMLPMDFGHMHEFGERGQRALALLDQVGLADHAHKLPTALSGGQQQRAAIARALANDPPLIVADEPTGNLDSKTAGAMLDLFQQLVSHGKTFIMVTHDPDLARQAARTITIADGEIVNDERRMNHAQSD
ncbi:MAG: ABC transporter ATP-binding protein [Anaerolineales bacterium]|nr:ABC transporter ATP-binding protein [Anaerolineales bacterium]